MKNMQVFVSAFLGGISIAVFGMTELLLCDTPPIASALLFGVMLLVVLTFNLHLVTAKAGYLFRDSNLIRVRAMHLLIAFVGNTVGAMASGELLRLLHYEQLSTSAAALIAQHFSYGIVEVLIGAVFCGMLMFVAVHAYRRLRGGIGGALVTLGTGATIVFCGFTHSVTDLFYMAFNHVYNGRAFAVVLLGVAGNLLGAIGIAFLYEYKKSEDEVYRKHEAAAEAEERRYAHGHRYEGKN